MLSAACSAAALLAPSWYLGGGRNQLLAAVRLLPKAVTLVQLLLPPSTALHELHWACIQASALGGNGLVPGVLAVVIWPAMFPVRSIIDMFLQVDVFVWMLQ
jgi:hypothetical protein